MGTTTQPVPNRSQADRQSPELVWLRNLLRAIALIITAVGFALRLWWASGTFLNPDEALHFFIANRSSWSQAYQASLTMAHPPLLIFLLYWWRNLGTSEIILRLPSILAGTAFCWIFFKWLEKLLGSTVALVGLTFAALLAPMVLLSSEVRQYELLLLFAIAGAYLLELAIENRSAALMLLSAACLYLALLSHYSAPLFVASLGIYGLLRLIRERPPSAVTIAWSAGQFGAAGLIAFLYLSHISRIRHTTMAEQAFDSWLYKSYFHSSHNNLIAFVAARTFSIFQFVLGQSVIGDLAVFLFAAGIVLLLRRKIVSRPAGPTPGQLATLLVLPFALNCVAALFDAYPYGGTRHCVYLAIFGLTGISVCIVRICGGRAVRSMAVALTLITLCWAFRSIRHPYIDRTDQRHARMDQALNFIQSQIPAADPIFVDYETGLELGHYLCQQKPISCDGSIPGFLVFTCGDHRIVSTVNDFWAFDPPMFRDQYGRLMAAANLKPDAQVWVAQVGWIVTLADDLKKQSPGFPPVSSFGKNIQFFPVNQRSALSTQRSAQLR